MADCSKTEVFFREWNRLCKSSPSAFFCTGCDGQKVCKEYDLTNCAQMMHCHPTELISFVQRWSDAHPLTKPKTYADDFFEKFPKAARYRIGENDTPYFCIDNYYALGKRPSCSLKCNSCWNETYKEE